MSKMQQWGNRAAEIVYEITNTPTAALQNEYDGFYTAEGEPCEGSLGDRATRIRMELQSRGIRFVSFQNSRYEDY